MKPFDKQIGSRLREARENQEMSQAMLADCMRIAGYTWAQATVWSVESGSRSLRLNEAFAISQILGLSLDYLTGVSDMRERWGDSIPPGLERQLKALSLDIEGMGKTVRSLLRREAS